MRLLQQSQPSATMLFGHMGSEKPGPAGFVANYGQSGLNRLPTFGQNSFLQVHQMSFDKVFSLAADFGGFLG